MSFHSTASAFMAQSFHSDPARSGPLPGRRTPPKPRIESDGRGWFTVHGGLHGPVQLYGRADAEKALAAIQAAAKAEPA